LPKPFSQVLAGVKNKGERRRNMKVQTRKGLAGCPVTKLFEAIFNHSKEYKSHENR
jgi:hypothetical protein